MKSEKVGKVNLLMKVVIGLNIVIFIINIYWLCHNVFLEKSEVIIENKTLNAIKLEENRKNRGYDGREYYYMNIYSRPTDVVFVGDSLTERVKWNELFPHLQTKNRGISSDTTEGVLARLDSVVQTEPKKIFIMIGINDIAQGKSMQDAIYNYENIISSLKETLPKSEIYIQSVLPVSGSYKNFNKSVVQYNDLLKVIVEEQSVTYIDLWSEFLDEQGMLKEEYSYDGIHLSADGYRKWREIISTYIEE